MDPKPRLRESPVSDGYRVCPDVSFYIESGGVLASNFRARRHVWLNLPLFNALVGGTVNGELRALDRTRFTNLDGLVADPTCLDRDPTRDSVVFGELSQALEYLAERFVVIKDDAAYDAYFVKKQSPLDRRHFGTFHQQLGLELRFRLRLGPAEWWRQQKFEPATTRVRKNLYKFVQEAFVDQYIAGLDLEQKTVLDFGCGNGIAARQFAARGAKVIGVDPDEKLLEEASQTIGPAFVPVPFSLSDSDPLAVLPKEPLDLVWLSDVLMFYFYPQDAGPATIAPARLLTRLTAHLRGEGRCVIMQPHGVFWLAPWLGDPKRPYAVITEYSSRVYSVVPALQDLCDAIAEAGLAITHIYEPKPDQSGNSADIRAYSFASAFPLWWVFECIKLQRCCMTAKES